MPFFAPLITVKHQRYKQIIGMQVSHVFPNFLRGASVADLFHVCCVSRGGLGGLAAWHLLGGQVGPPARWAATSNVARGSGTEEGPGLLSYGRRALLGYIICRAPEFP